MKILHTSDWHLGKSLYDFSLLEDAKHALDFVLGLVEREGVEAVIIAGDVYDRPVPSAEAVRLYDYFLTKAVSESGVAVIAVAGNHDSGTRLEFGSRLYRGSGYHVFGSVKANHDFLTLRDGFGEIRVYPLPWFHPAEIRVMYENPDVRTFDSAYRLALEKSAEKLDGNVRNIAVAHGYFANLSSHADKALITSDSEINLGGMDIVDSSYFSRFDYTALGHLHAPQRAGAENIRYSGSLLKYSVSEERQKKSCVIIDIKDKGNLNLQIFPIPPLRDVRSITGKFDDLMEPGYHENKSFDDYVFANILDHGALYPMEKLRTLFPHLLGLSIKPETDGPNTMEIRLPSEIKLSTLELFTRFYSDTYKAPMPDESLEYLKEIIQKARFANETA